MTLIELMGRDMGRTAGGAIRVGADMPPEYRVSRADLRQLSHEMRDRIGRNDNARHGSVREAARTGTM